MSNNNIDNMSDIENSDSDDIEQEAEQIKITKDFQENVIKFVKIDDLIKKKQSEITELKSQKKPCEENIIKYLDEIDENVIEITNGKLRKNKSETKVALNKEIIKNAINNQIQDPLIVEQILKIMDNRPKKVRTNIKRTSNRIRKKLNI